MCMESLDEKLYVDICFGAASCAGGGECSEKRGRRERHVNPRNTVSSIWVVASAIVDGYRHVAGTAASSHRHVASTAASGHRHVASTAVDGYRHVAGTA